MARSTESRLEDIGNKWIDDAFKVLPNDVPEIVYHYTDAAGLVGMLSSNEIWLTDYRFLNDRTEFIHTRSLVDRLLEDRMRQDPPAWFDELKQHIHDFRNVAPSEDSFVFSCSRLRDDLSQWRGYASEGCGFTIGFSGDSLMQLSNGEDDPFAFSRVIYDDKKQYAALNRSLNELEQVAVEARRSGAARKRLLYEIGRTFDWVANNRGALNKHESFSAEDEWRLVKYVVRGAGRIAVRARGKSLVPYVRQGGDQMPEIVEIGIGPGHANPAIIHAVEQLISGRSPKPKVYSADTPYRQN